jgi:hypothetical protein
MTQASVDSFFPSQTKGAANGVMMTPLSIAYRTGRRQLEGKSAWSIQSRTAEP